jgi:hypothetical protein
MAENLIQIQDEITITRSEIIKFKYHNSIADSVLSITYISG